ncbi:Cro/Cl family transcriptional regulator [Apilactobacillus micheneri]|uniref:Cro/Cl family transcriptional regulator n=1 Tax=Apilactobacillus micheneri TaxID=1899430 RepID=UPI000D03B44D|nr:Cro/Cl family transcriptional regulator [Apilactobacillus micheneri]
MKSISDNKLRISLKAARVNANMTQSEAAKKLTDITEVYITKDRIRYFEKSPQNVPDVFGKELAKMYKIPRDCIFFGTLSTKSCHRFRKRD